MYTKAHVTLVNTVVVLTAYQSLHSYFEPLAALFCCGFFTNAKSKCLSFLIKIIAASFAVVMKWQI